jgi:hypothetical protein
VPFLLDTLVGNVGWLHISGWNIELKYDSIADAGL